jgi:tetratricopeptide (TPR) repeat protein
LDCGKAVNFTYYDDLIGVAQRNVHPNSPEAEVAYLFLKKKGAKSLKNFDIDALERRLKKAKREKPRSVQLYNQIGNFYRIKGDARLSIECFRKALAVSPTNAEVLLNLARVLFLLGYLDDAINLTRR